MKNLSEKIGTFMVRKMHDFSMQEKLVTLDVPGVENPLVARIYSWPFQHVVIDNFLQQQQITEIVEYFDKLLSGGSASKGFSHSKLYDIYLHGLAINECKTISEIAFSTKMKSFVESLLETPLTHYTNATFHNNAPRTSDKYIHTDAVPVVFREQEGPEMVGQSLVGTGVQEFLSDNVLPLPKGFVAKERSATAILYLSSDWKPGLGGETGIFYKSGDRFIECESIAPKFNRLLLFKNSTNAWHNYKACSLPNRKSLIQWFHS
jgi:hypothetical protein